MTTLTHAKPRKKKIKTLDARVSYLYPGGLLIVVRERTDRKAGKIEWAEAYENIGVDVRFTEGRVIISSPGALAKLLKSRVFDVKVSSGSTNTKKAGIVVHNWTFDFSDGKGAYYTRETYDTSFPGILSNDMEWQRDSRIPQDTFSGLAENFKNFKRTWADMHLTLFAGESGKEVG